MAVTEVRHKDIYEPIAVLCDKLNDGLRNAIYQEQNINEWQGKASTVGQYHKTN